LNGQVTMPITTQDPKQNDLLAALPAGDFGRLLRHLEPVELALGQALHQSGSRQEYVYFPTTSLISLLHAMENGGSAGIALVGNEGMAGIALSMGGETTPSRAVVQSAGYGYRLRASVLQAEFGRGATLRHLLLRFTQALITQMAQTALCSQRHSVPQQLGRWLLLSLDRLPCNALAMTQGMIASMLGARAAGMIDAAASLQAQGLIEDSGGNITVPDRSRLEARVCPCYALVKRESDRLLGPKYHRLEAAVA
jgi:CRP-like cAMP-binding protein